MASSQRKSDNRKLLSAGDISLKSAAGVFSLPACDKMGDTGRIPDIPLQASFFHGLGNCFTQSKGPMCLCFLRVSLGSSLQYCTPEISLQDTIFSLRTNVSYNILAPNFHSKATDGSQHRQSLGVICGFNIFLLRETPPFPLTFYLDKSSPGLHLEKQDYCFKAESCDWGVAQFHSP